MLEIASEIVICLLLAALIGFFLGYLVCKSQSQKAIPVTNSEIEEKTNKEEPETEQQPTAKETPIEDPSVIEENPPSEDIEIPTENVIEEIEEQETEMVIKNEKVGQKPELLSQPRKGKKDNLTQIKGIGPKIEEKLNASGIYHFEQIANWTEENMIWLEAHTLFASRAKKESWITESKSFL